MSGDRRILYVAGCARAVATGTLAVVLGLHCAARGLSATETGLVVAAGLAGAAVAVLLVTVAGDRLGRRTVLVGLGVLGGAAPLVLLTTDAFPAIAGAAFLGMMNGMGRDRGASLVLEQAMLPATAPDAGRTRAFAWYTMLQDLGHAAGGLVGGVAGQWRPGDYGPALVLYAALALASGLVCLGLSPAVERDGGPRRALRPESRRVLWRVGGLFAIDSVAGGFISGAMLAVFFRDRFGAGVATIGVLFFAARAANAASHLLAAALAKRIGLVNTMVFTHAPSSVLLATVPFAPTFPLAATLFLFREGLVEMDVPTRQSYVMAVVHPDDRTVASGITNLVRMAGWAAGPALAGVATQAAAPWVPLVVAAALKLVYDALLWLAFRHAPPPEERAAERDRVVR